MSTITTRAGKGSPLTNTEVDENFTNLNDDKLESTDLSVSTGVASGGGSLSYSSGVFTFAPADVSSYITDLSSFTTTDLTEGANLYYTDERVDDRVNALIVPGLGITKTYDDTAGTLTIDSDTIEELCKNGTGSTILKGTPVYQTGTAGNAMVIAPADASSAATMPAVGVLSQDLVAEAEGNLILMGRISGVDTSAFGEGDVIYVASGGGYTNVRPIGQSVLVQNLGRITKVHASNGGGVIMGSGRANDVPNLTDGNVFIGNAGGTYDKRAIVTADISDLTATATELNYTDGVTSNIQTQLNAKGVGSVTSVSGTGTVQGLTLSGTVNSSGSLTLSGSLADVNLTSQVTGTLPIANGGTGSTTALGALTNFGLTATAAEINTLDGITATVTELNYTSNLSSDAQAQLDAKAVYPSQTGNSGKYLTTDGTNPSWAEVSGAGSVLIATYDDSSVSTIDIEDFTSTYDDYMIVGTWFSSEVSATPYIRIKTGGSYITSAEYYNVFWQGATSFTTSSSETQIQIGQRITDGGSGSSKFNLSLTVNNVNDTSTLSSVYGTGSSVYSGTGRALIFGGNLSSTTGAIEGIRLYASTGTVSCNLKVYGLKKA